MATRLRISGMNCDGCADIVSNALSEASGVDDVDVDLEAGEATVEGDADPDELVGKVERAGYDAEPLDDADGA